MRLRLTLVFTGEVGTPGNGRGLGYGTRRSSKRGKMLPIVHGENDSVFILGVLGPGLSSSGRLDMMQWMVKVGFEKLVKVLGVTKENIHLYSSCIVLKKRLNTKNGFPNIMNKNGCSRSKKDL